MREREEREVKDYLLLEKEKADCSCFHILKEWEGEKDAIDRVEE